MKPFKIGSQVRVTAIAGMQYEGRERVVARVPVEPFFAEVAGKAVKQLGQYRPASGGSFGEDYDPAYLAVKGTMTLWEVRTGMVNRPILVHDDDLESVREVPPPFPNRGIKPKRIEESPV